MSSHEIDPEWTEPFYTCHLEAPTDLDDLTCIVIEAIGTADADERFPRERRPEAVARLGRNPRALRLLGNLLRLYSLEELLGPPQDEPQEPSSPELTDRIEGTLLAKAREGMSNAAGQVLRDLTILREPASAALLDVLAAPYGDAVALTRELRERFILERSRDGHQVHPVVREVDGPRTAWRPCGLPSGS